MISKFPYLFIIILFFSVSCTTKLYLNQIQSPDGFGEIKISNIKKGNSDSVTFQGKFTDIETANTPEASAIIIIDSTAYNINKDGTYNLTFKHKDFFKLTTFTSPYYPLTTNNIKVKKGKIYKVDFLLKKDTNPIVD